jgi:hypothetical protein
MIYDFLKLIINIRDKEKALIVIEELSSAMNKEAYLTKLAEFYYIENNLIKDMIEYLSIHP